MMQAHLFEIVNKGANPELLVLEILQCMRDLVSKQTI